MIVNISACRKPVFLFLLIASGKFSNAQHTTVLPGNGASTSLVAPQGKVKFQRQFYLIDATELNRSGLQNGMPLSSIGFSIASPQDSLTKGIFRVYLQNTSDTVSRLDSNWTEFTQAGTVHYLTGLNTGNYEWQIRSNCSSVSPFSPSSVFKISSDTCKSPTHLYTNNITSNSATLQWIKPAFQVGVFKVEYSRTDVVNWSVITTSGDSYNLSGLSPGVSYQWKVSSVCSADSSQLDAVIFTTEHVNNCNAPSGLSVGLINDTTAAVSWNAATGASSYEISYRRTGTADWFTTVAISANATILNLAPGTNYQWRVRTVCSLNDYGDPVAGVSFTTTGATACYPPSNRYTDSLTAVSAKISWDAAAGATDYTVRYRQKDFISWSNAIAGMTLVHDDSLIINPATGNNDVNFAGGSPFTYTGNGLYIAFEYIDTSGGHATKENISLAEYRRRAHKDTSGRDSASFYMSLNAVSMDSLPPVITATAYRPETRLGSSSLKDSVAVLAIYTLGYNPVPYGNPSPVSAIVRNYTNSEKTYPVTLTVKDVFNAIKYTETINATVTADSLLTVNFSGWSPTVTGPDSVIVSVPQQVDESVLNNNRNHYIQLVNNALIAYADGSDVIASAGFDTITGLVLAKYKMNGCGAVNSAQVYLDPTAAGHSVYAVVLNASGAILAASAPFIPDSSNTGNYHSFYFSSPVVIDNNEDFYIGLAQPDSSAGFNPVAVQWEGTLVRTNAYYKAELDGTGITDHPEPGRLMIRAEIIADAVSPMIDGNLVVCPSGTTTLMAKSVTRRFADAVIDFSSQAGNNQFSAARSMGAPNVYPQYGANADAWMGSTADNQREYIVLGFPNSDSVNFVDIYETLNPGAIDTVYVKNPGTGLFEVVYSATTVNAPDSVARIKHITFPLTQFEVTEIRIAMNSPADTGYHGIDAVAIGRIENNPAFSSFLWTRETSSGPVNVGTGSSVSISDSGRYTLTVVNPRGCTTTASTNVITPSQDPPVIIASGPLTFCTGDSVKLKSNLTGGNLWSNGATTDSIFVKTSGTYTVTHDDGSGCGTTISAGVGITVNPLPLASVSGQPGICPGGNTTLTANPGGNTYLWSNGSTASSITVSNAGQFSVEVTDGNGCKASAGVSTFFVAKPTPKITGTTGFCPGSSTTLNAGAGYASYNWSGGQNTASIIVNAAGQYKVTVTNNFGCSGEDSIMVIQYTPPSPSISGSLTLCGGSTTLNAGGGYSAYLWSTNEATQSIIVTEEGTYSVTVTDFNGCTGNASATTVKDSLPPSPGPITGSANGICNSPGAIFSIDIVPEATHYVWFVPPGASIVSGQGETSVVIAFDNTFTSGDLIVAASNACGQSGSLHPRVFPLRAIPGIPNAISGQVSGVCGSTQNYLVSAVPGASSYTWTVPPGVTINNGQGTASINVTVSSAFAGGTLCVQANNACGSSQSKCISISGIPASPGSISGMTSVCFKAKNVLYSVSPVQGTTNYIWTVPEQASIVSGQGSNNILINFGNKSGNVTVRASNACGSSPVQSLTVIVSNCAHMRSFTQTGGDNPDAEQRLTPEVIANAGGIDTANAIMLEWTLGEPVIESVKKSDRLYTQGFHQPVIIEIAKESEILVSENIKITALPNPVRSVLAVQFRSSKEESLQLRLFDMNGKMLLTRPLKGRAGTLDINMLPYSNGMYLLNIRSFDGQVNQTIKIIKAN